ncbi:tail assembly chaperone [Staphylococcus equorum]|uniref:tail assembly chaperone n=1 Tax=Staphylococcus equorum TaxID=246432 RepID=UPI002407FFA9|nr:tail assembly chaperone [Staphylococcus equorum]MDG0843162.1 tail assembly chaperone [Staphylococcus equorum]
MTEAIKTLTINGKEITAKGSLMFDIEAKKFSGKEKDNTVPGFNAIYTKLINKDTEAIFSFWQCATAHLSERPTKEQIMDAVTNVIEQKDDTIELLAGAVDVMTNSGFFKQKTRQYWVQMNKGVQMVKKEEKEQTKMGIELMTDNFMDIMGAKPL